MKRAAYLLGAVVLLAGLAVLIAPAFVDTPAVRAEIQQRLAQAIDGQVTWEALEIGVFPAPHGELRKVRIELPERMSAAADRVQLYLRLWPLLLGRVEIASFVLSKPTVRIATQDGEKAAKDEIDAVVAYRRAMQPAVEALQRFAPDTVVRVEGAAVDPGGLRELNASVRTAADGVALELDAASDLWKRLSIKGRIEYASLAARAQVEVDALALDKDVPPATVRAELRTDAKSAIECDFEARLGSLAGAKGKVVLPAGKPAHLTAHLGALDLAQALAIARIKRFDIAESAQGRVSADVAVVLGPPWQAQIAITKSDAAVKIAQLPWKVSAHAAQLTISENQVRVAGASGAVGDSAFQGVAAQIDLGKTPRLSSASGSATLKLEQWFPWLRTKAPLDDIESLAGGVDVELKRLALRFDRPGEADYEAVATPRKVSAKLKALPAPVDVGGGSVRVDPARVRLAKVTVAILDTRTQISGTVDLKKLALDLALADGVLGEKVVQWALERGGVSPRFEPKTPLRFAARRIAWAPKGAVEADARIDFDGGPALALALVWQPERLELRRLAIKDAHSDVVLGATIVGDLIEATFAGTLQGQSIPAMLRQPPPAVSGTAQGKLLVTIDRKHPERSYAEGKLRIDALDLSWLAGRRVIVESADVSTDQAGLHITAARFDVEEQVIDLRGDIRRSEGAPPVIDARLESAGVVLDRLLPPPTDKPAPQAEASALWPLPVSGRIEVRSEFIQYQHHRIAPLEGSLSLEPRRARLEVREARLCGLSFPLEITAGPEDLAAAARITMKDEPLEAAMRCLTGDTVEITGNADLHAELRTHGRLPDLARNLTGTAHAEVRKGSVKRFALLGNILSFRGLASPGKMKDEGFPYRAITARGRFENGGFLVEESFFDSDAVRLAATGRVDLLGADSQLTVLVGWLTGVDRVAGAIPIVGDIFGGSMTALPVAVRGDIRDPSVVPLGPRAISDHLLGIFERTLKLPGKLAVPPGP